MLGMDQLPPSTMGRSKIWTGSLIHNNERAQRRSMIVRLLPHQQPRRRQVHQDGVEIPPCSILWNGTLQPSNIDHRCEPQLLPPALQHQLSARNHNPSNPGESPTGAWGQGMPLTLRLRHLEQPRNKLLDKITMGKKSTS